MRDCKKCGYCIGHNGGLYCWVYLKAVRSDAAESCRCYPEDWNGRDSDGTVMDASRSFKAQRDKPLSVYDDSDIDYDEVERIIRERM